ncbi:MAG: YicC family protein, partial [Rhodospirillaceae bacterium]|nr:YicC family protein [Rhodospirillaceae bacterium]
MNISSMTGFARSEGANEKCTWGWEGKSVNAKGLDVRLKLPRGFDFLEAPIRKSAAKHLKRGNIYINLDISWSGVGVGVSVNEDALASVLKAVAMLQDKSERGTDNLKPLAPASIDGILGLRGVLEQSDDQTSDEYRLAMEGELLAGFEAMMAQLLQTRKGEGAILAEVLAEQISSIEKLSIAATKVAATQPGAIKARLKEQVEALLADVSAIDETRLAGEAALLMTKADIREELDRLSAHVSAAKDLLGEKVPVGRRMDFLCQEFNREANTLCSKSSDVELT